MKHRLALLAVLLLATLRLAATDIDPNSYYRAVTAQDRPSGWADENWKLYVDMIRGQENITIETNSVVHRWPKMKGQSLLEYLDPKSVFNQFLPSRLVSAEKIPSPGEEAKAEQEAKLKAQANQGNGPLTEADRKGKPLYYAGSPEAEAQKRESAKEQDKAVAKFKKSGAPGNGPISGEGLLGKPVYYAGSPEAEAQMRESAKEQDEAVARFKKSGAPGNGPISGEGLLGKPVKNTGSFSEDEADERPVASTGNKFAKPMPGQGTKKEDTLFKNQNQNNPPQFQATENFIGIWAYPKDRGTGESDYRLVLVQLTGREKPDLMSLRKAKDAGYVPQNLKYMSLSAYPE